MPPSYEGFTYSIVKERCIISPGESRLAPTNWLPPGGVVVVVLYVPHYSILSTFCNPTRHSKFYFVKVVVSCYYQRSYTFRRRPPDASMSSTESGCLVSRGSYPIQDICQHRQIEQWPCSVVPFKSVHHLPTAVPSGFPQAVP